jgi:hypothetical protein
MDGFALAKEKGERINFRGTRMLIKVSNDDSEERYSLIETCIHGHDFAAAANH